MPSDWSGAPERHSEAFEPNILHSADEIARAEARNALRQYEFAMEILAGWIESLPAFELRFSHLLNLNRIALEGIHRSAGSFRVGHIRISNSMHEPPDATAVPDLIADMCAYINASYATRSALHLSAYILWRINWIHPFADGNGRTARILSYIVLSAKLGYVLPGATTIPEQIARAKAPYYEALEAADAAFAAGRIDVSLLEGLIGSCLAQQLLVVHDAALDDGHLGNAKATPPAGGTPISSNVVYRYTDVTYRPIYYPSVPDAMRTARAEVRPNWIERNPALVTAGATILGSVLTAIVTYALAR